MRGARQRGASGGATGGFIWGWGAGRSRVSLLWIRGRRPGLPAETARRQGRVAEWSGGPEPQYLAEYTHPRDSTTRAHRRRGPARPSPWWPLMTSMAESPTSVGPLKLGTPGHPRCC